MVFITRIKVKYLIIAFLINIVVFGLIYWVLWIKSPDSFIVNQEVNLTPLLYLQTLWQVDSPNGEIPDFSKNSGGLDDLNEISEEKFREYHDLSSLIITLENQSELLKKENNDVYEKFSIALEDNFKKYVQNGMSELYKERDELNAELQGIESILDKTLNPNEFQKISQLYLDKIEEKNSLNVKINQTNLDLLNEYFTEREKFFDPILESELEASNKRLTETENKLLDAKLKFYKLRGETNNALTTMYFERIGKLGFLDFFYFSLTVSLSNTFGDILPNHFFPRILAVTQLIINMVIISCLLTIVVDRMIKGKMTS